MIKILLAISVLTLSSCIHSPVRLHKPMTIIRSTHHGVYSCLVYIGTEQCMRIQ